jgi:hypothetical protein
MHALTFVAVILVSILLAPGDAAAFCGFYVARGDSRLFNRASKVVLVRDGDRTALTMANDYRGDPKDFAVVIPVPTFIRRDQIRVVDPGVVDHLDAYSAPRLVEYFDRNPCERPWEVMAVAPPMSDMLRRERAAGSGARSLGVTVEASYTVGEYDILILSAEESGGLETWLRQNGYRVPRGAAGVLGSYIKQRMRFFVARVNLAEQSAGGFTYLRPLQVEYVSPKFMLPIRLGTVNADGPQDLFVLALTRTGRIEPTNYRTVRLPAGPDLPTYIKSDFASFYRAMFAEQVRREDMRVVFLEYAWDMAWCDPCAANPLSPTELKRLGVFWMDRGPAGNVRAPAGGADVFVTRLHLRYDAEHFPEDLVFQETADRANFQARFVVRHPWTGGDTCPRAEEYRRDLARRHEREAQALASLTGWNIDQIRRRMGLGGNGAGAPRPSWLDRWRGLWR